MTNKQQIQKKLVKLRKRWLDEPHNRKIIEIQANLLKMAKSDTFLYNVHDALIEGTGDDEPRHEQTNFQ